MNRSMHRLTGEKRITKCIPSISLYPVSTLHKCMKWAVSKELCDCNDIIAHKCSHRLRVEWPL